MPIRVKIIVGSTNDNIQRTRPVNERSLARAYI